MKRLIDKDNLIAEIDRIMDEQQEICKADVALGKNPDAKNIEVIHQFQQFVKFINELEVKEVDLEKEIKRFTMSKELYEADSAIKAVAEHFFELGLKTQN